MEQKHPLLEYAAAEGKSIEEIAKAAECSRMTLYRLMAGKQNATIELLQRVSDATGGRVPASAFLLPPSPQKASA
ncbi:helix-turn-helix domain-containing protein [Devosia honganensis]|uniref:Helix-turn-helix domain-containing protein n=1 Tax=Devosia honganensis TaxID=1610527 RepID=A0ABV7X2U4_9HYPH